MTIIAIAVIFALIVLVVFVIRNAHQSDIDAVQPRQKMMPVKFNNIDNSKYGRRRTTETENIPVQPTTVKTMDIPVVVEPDETLPQVVVEPEVQIIIEIGKTGAVLRHGKYAIVNGQYTEMPCRIVGMCSNGSLILDTLNGPIRKKKKYVSF